MYDNYKMEGKKIDVSVTFLDEKKKNVNKPDEIQVQVQNSIAF